MWEGADYIQCICRDLSPTALSRSLYVSLTSHPVLTEPVPWFCSSPAPPTSGRAHLAARTSSRRAPVINEATSCPCALGTPWRHSERVYTREWHTDYFYSCCNPRVSTPAVHLRSISIEHRSQPSVVLRTCWRSVDDPTMYDPASHAPYRLQVEARMTPGRKDSASPHTLPHL